MNRGKFSFMRLIVIVILFVLGFALFKNKEEAKTIVRILLESSWPAVIIWLAAIIGVFAEKFFTNSSEYNAGGFIYKSFGKYADASFAIATYGLSGSTSLALLKGLYLQLFFAGTYFSGFGDFDLVSIFVISSFLLFYSIIAMTRQMINAVFKVDATEVTPA